MLKVVNKIGKKNIAIVKLPGVIINTGNILYLFPVKINYFQLLSSITDYLSYITLNILKIQCKIYNHGYTSVF